MCEQAVITLKEIGVVSEWVDGGKKAFERALGKQYEEATIVSEDFKFEGKHVLLAEDHPLNVEVATRLLESKGFKVEDAENGLRALEMFTMAPVGYYDAILMDIRMPQMDGLQASNAITFEERKCKDNTNY